MRAPIRFSTRDLELFPQPLDDTRVDWERREVAVYRRRGAALRLVRTVTGDGALDSPLLPGFSCPIARLWLPTD